MPLDESTLTGANGLVTGVLVIGSTEIGLILTGLLLGELGIGTVVATGSLTPESYLLRKLLLAMGWTTVGAIELPLVGVTSVVGLLTIGATLSVGLLLIGAILWGTGLIMGWTTVGATGWTTVGATG